jgi:hypothetical protein
MMMGGFTAAHLDDLAKPICIRCGRSIPLGNELEKIPLIALPKSNAAGFDQVCDELCEKLCERLYLRGIVGLRWVTCEFT